MATSVVSFVPSSSLKYFLQTLQYQYSVFPASVQVAFFPSVLLNWWPVAGTTVAANVVSFVPASSLKYFLQALQYQYSVFPSSVQVAALLSLLLNWWPVAGITVAASVVSFVPASSLKYFLQTLQYQYSIFPASVQVAALLSVLLNWWPGEVSVSVR